MRGDIMLYYLLVFTIGTIAGGAVVKWRWNVSRSQNPPYCSVLCNEGFRRVLVCKRPPKGDWFNGTPVIYGDGTGDWTRKGEQGDYFVYETTRQDIPEPRWAVLCG